MWKDIYLSIYLSIFLSFFLSYFVAYTSLEVDLRNKDSYSDQAAVPPQKVGLSHRAQIARGWIFMLTTG
jgi:hypothetical protein